MGVPHDDLQKILSSLVTRIDCLLRQPPFEAISPDVESKLRRIFSPMCDYPGATIKDIAHPEKMFAALFSLTREELDDT